MSKPAKIISLELLNSYFYEEDGHLKWKIPHGNKKCGADAGGPHSTGYLVVSINNRQYQVHRILYQLYHQCDLYETELIDHIDGNKMNNNMNNLRVVNISQNKMNSKMYITNTSGYKHITHQNGYDKGHFYECWHVNIRCKNRKQIQKRFPYDENGLKAAITYRDEILNEYHGDYMGVYNKKD